MSFLLCLELPFSSKVFMDFLGFYPFDMQIATFSFLYPPFGFCVVLLLLEVKLTSLFPCKTHSSFPCLKFYLEFIFFEDRRHKPYPLSIQNLLASILSTDCTAMSHHIRKITKGEKKSKYSSQSGSSAPRHTAKITCWVYLFPKTTNSFQGKKMIRRDLVPFTFSLSTCPT